MNWHFAVNPFCVGDLLVSKPMESMGIKGPRKVCKVSGSDGQYVHFEDNPTAGYFYWRFEPAEGPW